MNKDDSLRDEELDGVCGGMYPASTKSGGVCASMAPAVCIAPTGPALVAAPLPGTTASATGQKVLDVGDAVAVKGAQIFKSTGDEAGTLKDLVSF